MRWAVRFKKLNHSDDIRSVEEMLEWQPGVMSGLLRRLPVAARNWDGYSMPFMCYRNASSAANEINNSIGRSLMSSHRVFQAVVRPYIPATSGSLPHTLDEPADAISRAIRDVERNLTPTAEIQRQPTRPDWNTYVSSFTSTSSEPPEGGNDEMEASPQSPGQ